MANTKLPTSVTAQNLLGTVQLLLDRGNGNFFLNDLDGNITEAGSLQDIGSITNPIHALFAQEIAIGGKILDLGEIALLQDYLTRGDLVPTIYITHNDQHSDKLRVVGWDRALTGATRFTTNLEELPSEIVVGRKLHSNYFPNGETTITELLENDPSGYQFVASPASNGTIGEEGYVDTGVDYIVTRIAGNLIYLDSGLPAELGVVGQVFSRRGATGAGATGNLGLQYVKRDGSDPSNEQTSEVRLAWRAKAVERGIVSPVSGNAVVSGQILTDGEIRALLSVGEQCAIYNLRASVTEFDFVFNYEHGTPFEWVLPLDRYGYAPSHVLATLVSGESGTGGGGGGSGTNSIGNIFTQWYGSSGGNSVGGNTRIVIGGVRFDTGRAQTFGGKGGTNSIGEAGQTDIYTGTDNYFLESINLTRKLKGAAGVGGVLNTFEGKAGGAGGDSFSVVSQFIITMPSDNKLTITIGGAGEGGAGGGGGGIGVAGVAPGGSGGRGYDGTRNGFILLQPIYASGL